MALLLMVLIINGRKEDLQEKKIQVCYSEKQRLFFQSERKQIRENDEQQQTEYLSVSSVTNNYYLEGGRK